MIAVWVRVVGPRSLCLNMKITPLETMLKIHGVRIQKLIGELAHAFQHLTA
jgi:hypothetical protein